MSWDEDGCADVGYVVQYYCKLCEDFFQMSPIAPSKCPYCFAGPQFIIGPIMTKEYDINDLVRKHDKKYGRSNRR